MAFKLKKKNEVSHKDPESLFRDLRSRKVEGLLSQQADILREYLKYNDETDIALELPTGSGKTLVGLLIAEWRRIQTNSTSLFICPTNQLVHQVAEQAYEKYGINVAEFVGSNKKYEPASKSKFLQGEVIGVTNYSSLFNSNPFFKDLGTIIFDDAHAAENYVSKCWSLEIFQGEAKHILLFNSILTLIQDYIPEHDRLSFQYDENQPIDKQWVNLLPAPSLLEIKDNLIAAIDANITNTDLSPVWSMLRENIEACALYYTNKTFLLRPIIPPTNQHQPFANAGQRIYMSATLGQGGDLERLFGTYRMKRIPAPTGWDRQGIGRRFILLPMCQFTEDESRPQAIRWIRKFPRALILSPSNIEANEYEQVVKDELSGDGFSVYRSDQIEKSKRPFTDVNKAVAILANRYDGIDLNGDECRYLIVSGLPEATNLQERFLMARMGANIMFQERIRTRITQAVGRCTRSSTDWALVVLIGEKAHSYFMNASNRSKLHPELQAELSFGLDQSSGDLSEIESNIDSFIAQNDEWKTAHDYIIEQRDECEIIEDQSINTLADTVNDEIKYTNSIWSNDFSEALSHALDVVNKLSGEALRGYRAWWYYLAGNAAYYEANINGQKEYTSKAREFYTHASKAAPALAWLKQLKSNLDNVDTAIPVPISEHSELLERLEQQFDRLGKASTRILESKFKEIREGMLSPDSLVFENAQVILGEMLGYIARNSEETSAPDPWWILTKNQGVVFEDYTSTNTEQPKIGKNKILQARGHLEWLENEHPGVKFNVIMCSKAEFTTPDSKPFNRNCFYIHVDEMREFAEQGIGVIRKLWESYSVAGDISWRESALQLLAKENFLPDNVLSRLTKTPLESLLSSE